MSEISKAEGEAWQVGFEEGYNAGKREAADRIEELERQVAMWTDVHDADSLRISELERAASEIFSEKDRITAEFLTDQAVRIKELERALRADIATMEEQARRMDRWGRSHHELDKAIEEARAVLEKGKRP